MSDSSGGSGAQSPVHDARELHLMERLTEDYRKFSAPGPFGKAMGEVSKRIASFAPERLRRFAEDAVKLAAEADFIKTALEHAGRGFGELVKLAARVSQSPDGVVKTLRSNGIGVESFEHVCGLRSYSIERVCTRRNAADILAALSEGAATGAPGFLGVPFNILLRFFLYFRAAQATGIYYGYDVPGDPRELEFASEATLSSLAPNTEKGAETMAGLIGKMMLAANVTAVRHALGRKTYAQMAKRGGAELLYVQIRALANRAAARALEGAGKTGMERSVFRTLLERVGSRLPKEAGMKSVPLLGAVVGGLSDGYYMSRVLKGSNLIYHKRFLFEKEHRVSLLSTGGKP
jgi:hypothetical protein